MFCLDRVRDAVNRLYNGPMIARFNASVRRKIDAGDAETFRELYALLYATPIDGKAILKIEGGVRGACLLRAAASADPPRGVSRRTAARGARRVALGFAAYAVSGSPYELGCTSGATGEWGLAYRGVGDWLRTDRLWLALLALGGRRRARKRRRGRARTTWRSLVQRLPPDLLRLAGSFL